MSTSTQVSCVIQQARQTKPEGFIVVILVLIVAVLLVLSVCRVPWTNGLGYRIRCVNSSFCRCSTITAIMVSLCQFSTQLRAASSVPGLVVLPLSAR